MPTKPELELHFLENLHNHTSEHVNLMPADLEEIKEDDNLEEEDIASPAQRTE